jgi:hypothetical protein
MKSKLALVTVMCVVLLAANAWAQSGKGRNSGRRIYNPATVETMSGEVVSVDQTTSKRGRSLGVHFTLKTEKETIPVHLGPGWYMDQQGVKLAPGDKVEVSGSRVTYQGKPVIIAGQVKKDGKTLQLRDANGVPAWAGQGRR